jgi:hypothetical protein
MRWSERLIVALAPWVGGMWVILRRRRYRRIGRPFTPAERSALAGFFEAALLERVRLAVVPRIEPPLGARVLPVRRFGSLVDLGAVRGMAFGDAIVTTQDPPTPTLLFHEMVHVVQYELFGVRPMLARYVGDYFDRGRDYFAIDAERCAYDLQARFDASLGYPFDVAQEVTRMMRA